MQAPRLAMCAWCFQAQRSRFLYHYLASVLSWQTGVRTSWPCESPRRLNKSKDPAAVITAWQDLANSSRDFFGPLCSHFEGTLRFVSSNSRRSDPPAPCQSSHRIDLFACFFPGRVCGALWNARQQDQLKAKDNHKQTSTLKVMMPSFPSSAKRPIGD